MIHPTAIIETAVVLGEDTVIWQYAHVRLGTTLGAHCSVGGHTEIGRYCTIGDRTRIGHGCFIPDRTRIGSGVFIGPGVAMADDRYPIVNAPMYTAAPPVIEDDVSIGIHATILPGVRLGRGCRIGAGAVVVHDVAPQATVVGNPAHNVRRVITTINALAIALALTLALYAMAHAAPIEMPTICTLVADDPKAEDCTSRAELVPGGLYRVDATVVDQAGNSALLVLGQALVDGTPPAVDVESIVITVEGKTVSVSFRCRDAISSCAGGGAVLTPIP